jgi:hypothetical protein
VEIATPIASAPATTGTIIEEPLPRLAAPAESKADGAWARTFPKDKTFAAFEVGEVSRALLVWRVGPSHFVKRVDGAEPEDYPVNHVSTVDLVVRASGRDTVISLGELSGWTETHALSYCKHRGFHLGPQMAWSFPDEPSVAVAFSIGITQGTDDFIVVRDGATLHVLHGTSDDGRCDDATQGPLHICAGAELARVAEIHMGLTTALFEIVVEPSDGGTAPVDCAHDRYGERLSPP